MTTNPHDPALQGAMTFYSCGMYPVFDRIGAEASREAADFCSNWSMEQPLCRDKKGNFPQREVPHFGKQSIVYAVTMIAAFLVWMQKGQHCDGRGPLIEAAMMGWRLYENKPPRPIEALDQERYGHTAAWNVQPEPDAAA